jgi:hypothetical protein
MSVLSKGLPTRQNGDAGIASGQAFARSASGSGYNPAEVIVNADDWGNDTETTDRILDCYRAESVSSVSAMVFMADSERAAEIARQESIDAGLHLNFTTEFSAAQISSRLFEHQQEIARTLNGNRLAQALYHPRLTASFEYVVKAQIEEFARLYGGIPDRFDGHHHMHLCANVICQKLLPARSIVRRNLSFGPGEKRMANRLYRQIQDRRLAQRYHLADYFFDLRPVVPSARLERIFALGRSFNVELETHPIRDAEYRFLMSGELQRCAGVTRVANGYVLRTHLPVHLEESQA